MKRAIIPLFGDIAIAAVFSGNAGNIRDNSAEGGGVIGANYVGETGKGKQSQRGAMAAHYDTATYSVYQIVIRYI